MLRVTASTATSYSPARAHRRTLIAARSSPRAHRRVVDLALAAYFCNGAVVRHLRALGFESVYNRNEDFYATDAAGKVPEHDVVVTNPPYSGTHPQRLLEFLARNAKPWLALMPNWVVHKEYYHETEGETYYVWPLKRYCYWTPRGRRDDVVTGGSKAKTHGHTNAALGSRTSPFVSFWYGGSLPPGLSASDITLPLSCRMCRWQDDLPAAVKP